MTAPTPSTTSREADVNDASPALRMEGVRKTYQVVPQVDEEDSEQLERLDADSRAVVEQFRSVQQEIAEDKPIMEKLLEVGRQKKAADDGTFEFLDAYMLGKLAGHSMFGEAAALDRLKMCADCRVVDMVKEQKQITIFDV